MEGCILCLDLNKELAESIAINSNEKSDLNIKNMIEKHLWSMNHIENSSWLCATCWRELYEFHKFYTRIEEAHIDFGLMMNNGSMDEKEILHMETTVEIGNKFEENTVDALKDFLIEYDLSDNHLGDDIEEQKSLIKNELTVEEIDDDMPLLQRRKRGRPRKDTCNGTRVPEVLLTKTKKNRQRKVKDVCNDVNGSPLNKKCKRKKNNATLIEDIKTIPTSEIKQEDNVVSLPNDHSISLDNKDNNTDTNDESDRDSLVHNDNARSPSPYVPKTNRNERDKFLEENFNITCFVCNIPLKTFFAMCKHFEQHHDERGHIKCCNKKFYRRSILVDHVHRHLDPNYFKCKQCGKVLADRRCLELHVESHESNPEKNHCCDVCGKGFAKLGVLKKHRMIHLSDEEKQFPCSECGKNFGTNYLRSSHYRSVHLKKYVKICDICGKGIRCKDVFERHMLQHEGKTAPSVSCDVCGLRLTDNKALKRHKDMIHPAGGKQEYTCSICSKTSPNLKAHKRHVQYKHIMGYDHKCTICEKAFKRAQTLREHMASHTGSILYTCPWCPKTFNSNANMHNHRKRVHPKEWEETSRQRYSGKLPPNYKPPTLTQPSDFAVAMDI